MNFVRVTIAGIVSLFGILIVSFVVLPLMSRMGTDESTIMDWTGQPQVALDSRDLLMSTFVIAPIFFAALVVLWMFLGWTRRESREESSWE